MMAMPSEKHEVGEGRKLRLNQCFPKGFPVDMVENKSGGSAGGKTLVCGIDEAGRGPLAGPVCAAAVILPGDFPLDFLDDSKN